MWISEIRWNSKLKSLKMEKSKVQRIKKVDKSIKPENDLNKHRYQRIKSFSSILDVLL